MTGNSPFICEQETAEAGDLILQAARHSLPHHSGYLRAVYRHCQWSIICDRCGCEWDAYDSRDDVGFGFVLMERQAPFGGYRCRI